MKKCEWCGKLFVVRKNAEKYCSEECRHEGVLESKRKYSNEYNKRRVYNTRVKALVTLGSKNTALGKSRNEDFEKEHLLIQKEMKNLKI